MLQSDSFIKLFRTDILPKLDAYEKERKHTLLIAGLLDLSPLVVFILMLFRHEISIAFIFFAITWIYIVNWFFKKGFENKVKTEVMPLICNILGKLKWSNYIDLDKELMELSLVPRYDFCIIDDAFEGCYNNVKYSITEAGFHRKVHPVFGAFGILLQCLKIVKKPTFSGMIVKIEMNKDFKGNTIIKPNSSNSHSKKLNRTVMEDIIFEGQYDVFTDDEIEARYLITTAFMERLNNIKLAFSAKDISCAFCNKSFFIVVKTDNDLFSIGDLRKPINDPSPIFNMYNEIQSIINLIDYFHLDKKLGL